MKKLLISTAVTLGLAGSALAADLPAQTPVYKAPPPVLVTTNWTGCYIAAGGGYGMFDQRHSPVGNPAATTGESDTAGKGWFGTVQAGCDYQFAPTWVVGVFGDYDLSGLKGNYLSGAPGGGFGAFGEEKMKDAWAVGARVGYLVFPKLLTYVAGGYTQARFDGFMIVKFQDRPALGFQGWKLGEHSEGEDEGLGIISHRGA